MWAIIKEICAYILFIWLMFVISYGNRDPDAYELKRNIEYNFIVKTEFRNVTNANEWWDWAYKTLIPELKVR